MKSPFSRETKYSSALSGISSMRGDNLRGKRYEKNKNHIQNNCLEYQRCTYRKRKTKGVCKPKADSEGNERFRRTGLKRYP